MTEKKIRLKKIREEYRVIELVFDRRDKTKNIILRQDEITGVSDNIDDGYYTICLDTTQKSRSIRYRLKYINKRLMADDLAAIHRCGFKGIPLPMSPNTTIDYII